MSIEDCRWISSGELAKNQYVTVLALKPYQEEVILPTGEKTTLLKEDKNPWIKGLPFRVANVKLPIVMLHNVCKVPNIPPLVIYDTRQMEFLEVDEEYVLAYKIHMFPDPVPEPPKANTEPSLPSQAPNEEIVIESPEGAEDSQIYLDFGDDEPDDDEDDDDPDTESGEPPVVLV